MVDIYHDLSSGLVRLFINMHPYSLITAINAGHYVALPMNEPSRDVWSKSITDNYHIW